ncbi:MAG: HU family DNA-binding protein [Bacteroidales bacterium]|nr:HU family DNA-binding protein [Bacteroidales bacterium]MCM1147519.1 HU family DNA-binding protein [Bacteroidales bacterium]MCM1206188.1 HU family DNA-binding protein [Bacillota bacterium]MCM1509978.1 HU family DNA-binding protein [Clostridium sp.]
MSTMKDIARTVADKHGLTRSESEQFLSAMFELLKSTLQADDQVKVKGLGTFKVQTVKPRSSINVNTGERVMIDSHEKISFTPDKAMAESVNKPFGHFETVVLNDGVVFDDMEDTTEKADETVAVNPQQEMREEVNIQEEPEASEPVSTGTADVGTGSGQQKPAPMQEEAENVGRGTATVPEIKQEKKTVMPVQETVAAEPEPVADDTVMKAPPAAAAMQDNDSDDDEEAETPDKAAADIHGKNDKTIYLLSGVFLALFFVAGFFVGRMTANMDTAVTPKPAVPVKKTVVRKVVKAAPKAVPAENADTAEAVNPEKELPEQTVAGPVKEKETLPAASYDSDPRIRTGAYIITGIDKTVTAAKGQTLESISRTYLGPGMECYVEAVNGGVKEIREGVKVKIPALKVKKKKVQ